jgi:uncharacterized protein YjbI with pentapeptide repeats
MAKDFSNQNLNMCRDRFTKFWLWSSKRALEIENDKKRFSRLMRYTLKSKKLESANFSWANISEIEFKGKNFKGAVFNFTNMEKTRFIDCDFRDADFTNANMMFAVFKNCDLRNARFDVNCTRAHFISILGGSWGNKYSYDFIPWFIHKNEWGIVTKNFKFFDDYFEDTNKRN